MIPKIDSADFFPSLHGALTAARPFSYRRLDCGHRAVLLHFTPSYM